MLATLSRRTMVSSPLVLPGTISAETASFVSRYSSATRTRTSYKSSPSLYLEISSSPPTIVRSAEAMSDTFTPILWAFSRLMTTRYSGLASSTDKSESIKRGSCLSLAKMALPYSISLLMSGPLSRNSTSFWPEDGLSLAMNELVLSPSYFLSISRVTVK